MLRLWIVAAVAALLSLGPAPSRAGTATASLAVSATVAGTCTVSGGPLAFGAYTPSTLATQQSALDVNCTQGTAYVVALDNGAAGARRMTGPGGATLPYEIYRDGARSQRWGDGSSAATGTGTGSVQTLPLYASISPTAATTGSYSDMVTVTLTY